MKLLKFPLYVTAHDFDFIAIFDPRPESARTPVRKLSVQEQISDLIEKLNDSDPHLRFRAAIKLGSLGPAAGNAIASLIERLDDPDQATRSSAADAMSRIEPESERVASALVARFKQEQEWSTRIEIVRALGHSPAKQAVETLAHTLSDQDASIRRFAAISLKLLGPAAKHAAPALERLLETETDIAIRSQATVALKKMREG